MPMKPNPISRVVAVTLLAIATFLSAQALNAGTEPKISGRASGQVPVDIVRIIQAAMPTYDRFDLPYAPHNAMVFDSENDPLHYQVYFSPMEVRIDGHLLIVILNKESLEIVRVIGPDEHVR